MKFHECLTWYICTLMGIKIPNSEIDAIIYVVILSQMRNILIWLHIDTHVPDSATDVIIYIYIGSNVP